MFLKSLTLKGFKSFADRTHMVFDPGLTVVVGPNGSGKSNVSDAILWVLGEQSAKMLRGQAMEDVVFSGSSARKPVGVAEVTLVLDNADHTLPVDFAEVGITRRMYRSGESEYLINGAPARLMDIQDILHDSGLGKDTHSIISQGKLDSILSSRPEERRALIEEAAGISKHRRRKERSQRKLADMDKNLVRARDVARELNRQLRPLERQVDRAKRYNELDSRLSELTCQLAVDDVRRLQQQWGELQGRSNEAAAAIELAQFRVDEKTRELEKLQSMLEQKGLFVGDLGEQRRRCADILGRLESDMRLLEEKGRNMVDRLSETRLTLSQVERQRSEAQSEREDVSSRLCETRSAADSLAKDVSRLEPAAKAATAVRREAGSEQARLTSDQRDCQHALDRATLDHAKLTDEISNAEVEDQMFASRIEQIDETLETTRAALESRTRRLEELEGDLAEAKGGAEKAQAAIGERKASHDEAARVAADARHELESARGKLAQAKATLRALRDVDAQLGSGRDSLESRVLSADELSSLVRCRLADVVSAPAELDSLVERLLGETLGAPVVGSGDDVARIMDAARGMSGASGSLTVLNLSEHAPEPVEACGERLVDLLLHHVVDDVLVGVEVRHGVEAQALNDQHHLLLLLQDEQVLLLDVVVRHVQDALQVDQAHDLTTAQADVQRLRVLLALLVHRVHVRHVVVRQVARDLRNVVLVHVPADRLQLLQAARLLRAAARRAHVQRDAVRLVLGAQHVDVERHQQLARAAHGRAPAGDELYASRHVVAPTGRTEVGLPLLGHDALGHGLVLAGADLRQSVSVGTLRLGVLVHVAANHPRILLLHGNAQLLGGAAGELARNLDAVIHRHTLRLTPRSSSYTNRHEGAHIASTHSGMLAVLLGHIDQLVGDAAGVQSTLDDALSVTHEGVHSSVSGFARIDIQHSASS